MPGERRLASCSSQQAAGSGYHVPTTRSRWRIYNRHTSHCCSASSDTSITTGAWWSWVRAVSRHQRGPASQPCPRRPVLAGAGSVAHRARRDRRAAGPHCASSTAASITAPAALLPASLRQQHCCQHQVAGEGARNLPRCSAATWRAALCCGSVAAQHTGDADVTQGRLVQAALAC